MTQFTAWIDESGSNQALDPGTYILSAAICGQAYAETARETMRQLLVVKGGKLHWRDEERRRQQRITETLATLQVEHLIVVRSDAATTDRPERQRRLCMERLLPELVSFGVSTAILESRGRKDDQRDHQTLDYLRRKRMLQGRLHLDHLGGRAEPMLWISDACCGAVTQMRSGDPQLYSLIEHKVTLINVET
ncbi:hypothetical protein [Mycobacteroides abscessus]|uniref:hypothetical protein n=1 Tax=Mycobacteroides abscessus TaxID=36809 RepID=UPI00187776A1|nr:hypothetical protein [Mycobacteroides abscessus]MDB2192916.1 hypothetical protein [Mycobacteroides abscessus subsp. abscessus]